MNETLTELKDKIEFVGQFCRENYNENSDAWEHLYNLHYYYEPYLSPTFYSELQRELESIYYDIIMNFVRVDREETYSRKFVDWVPKEAYESED
jgi:hypothetical protein